jgi:hypothetical protein
MSQERGQVLVVLGQVTLSCVLHCQYFCGNIPEREIGMGRLHMSADALGQACQPWAIHKQGVVSRLRWRQDAAGACGWLLLYYLAFHAIQRISRGSLLWSAQVGSAIVKRGVLQVPPMPHH